MPPKPPDSPRIARLNRDYRQYLLDGDTAAFICRIGAHYTPATLERLAVSPRRETRRAAVLALGLLGDFSSNAVLGRALVDDDRGVRRLAENGIVLVWQRAGNEEQRSRLAELVRLNAAHHYQLALRRASELISAAPGIAEAWNQRAIAFYGLERYRPSISDCRRALELNTYHFGAAAGMGQCYTQLGQQRAALDCFRRALRLNPGLEGVRIHVAYLERALRHKP